MTPAHQRLHAPHDPVVQPHEGLVLQHELVPVHRRPQRAGQRLARHPVRVALRVEERPARLAVLLRPVQRGVRGLHQLGGVGADGRPLHDADRGRDGEPLPRHVERPLERGQHGRGEVGELLGPGGALHQQRELVAAEPRHQMAAGRRALGQPLRDLGQQPVADAVAERVVDGLEAVEVEVAQPDPATAAKLVRRRLQRHGQPLEEQVAVGQPGHRVVHLEVAQPGPQVVPLADVGHRQQRVAAVGERRDDDLGPYGAAAGLGEPAGAAQVVAAAVQHLAVRGPGARVRAQVGQVGGGGGGEPGGVGAEQRAERRVRGEDEAAPVDHGHRQVCAVEGGSVIGETVGPVFGAVPGVVVAGGCATFSDHWQRRCGHAALAVGGSAHRSLPRGFAGNVAIIEVHARAVPATQS